MSSLIGHSLGRYHIIEQLGQGGMATVYKAYDTRLERDVAVKIIRKGAFPPEQLERILKRFEREAKALAKLSHPNIVKVLDYGDHEGVPYLVMEYLPGGTLKGKLAGGQKVAWREALQLLLPIAQALSYAHANKIIHRDIKPSNILITQTGEPMLSDFGIAKILDMEETHDLTATGVGIGTPEYMAPEQGMGQSDERADIYALGIVLYQMVTGHVPFRADTPMAILLKKNQESLPSPRQFVPSLPTSIEKLLIKMLAREPEHRYQTIREVVTAFERLLSGDESVAEMPPSQATQPAHKANWIWIAGGTGLVLFTLICLAGGIILASNAFERSIPNPTQALLATETGEGSASETATPASPSQATPTVFLTATKIVLPAVSTKISPKDGAEMVYIPEGEFLMGSDTDEPYFWGAEAPKHVVYLDAYWIYRTEVTNSMYRECVKANACPYPVEIYSRTHDDYFTNPQYDTYPVIYVTYEGASAYCRWAGARLPTEAEWEKAARGTDGRLFPWGNGPLQSDLANFCDVGCPNPDSNEIESDLDDGYRDVAPVGSFPKGISPFGALDMAGNVLEWVSDWYSASYYSQSPYKNPLGLKTGTRHPIRGGSWGNGREGLRPAARASLPPMSAYDTVGFRCALSAP